MKPCPDHVVLQRLARRWMELACLPVMDERRRLWTALNDLHPERPMVMFETWTLENYVRENELECIDPYFRAVEMEMRRTIRQVEEIGDDMVIEPHWRLYWDIRADPPGFGVGLTTTHADDAHGGQVGYTYNHPIHTVEDVARLKPRTWQVEKEKTRAKQARLQEAFGDALPVVIHGTGGLHAGLTGDLFRLIGNDNLLMWTYDAPEALKQVMAYLRDDRLAYFHWLEAEGLLGLNNDSELAGSGSPGFTTHLPKEGFNGTPRLRDVWVWMESQETTMISPAMFTRLFLPFMAEVSQVFGLIYYGCCEPVHDRWDKIAAAIPHVRGVSISPWCDMRLMGEKLGRERVFSRKPKPWPISGPTPDFETLEKDLDDTLFAT
ncbi:MAG: hypothetical protein IH586_00910, partial [Anaerolineaceae bacterium]|nr:hypothetical protein [Anaerolineaceae bacterium]